MAIFVLILYSELTVFDLMTILDSGLLFWLANILRRDFDQFRFGLVRNRSDFDSSASVNRKRVYGSVCDQSEPSSWAGSVRFDMADVYMRK